MPAAMNWAQAVKVWNSHKKSVNPAHVYCLPRKGTPEHAHVKHIQQGGHPESFGAAAKAVGESAAAKARSKEADKKHHAAKLEAEAAAKKASEAKAAHEALVAGKKKKMIVEEFLKKALAKRKAAKAAKADKVEFTGKKFSPRSREAAKSAEAAPKVSESEIYFKNQIKVVNKLRDTLRTAEQKTSYTPGYYGRYYLEDIMKYFPKPSKRTNVEQSLLKLLEDASDHKVFILKNQIDDWDSMLLSINNAAENILSNNDDWTDWPLEIEINNIFIYPIKWKMIEGGEKYFKFVKPTTKSEKERVITKFLSAVAAKRKMKKQPTNVEIDISKLPTEIESKIKGMLDPNLEKRMKQFSTQMKGLNKFKTMLNDLRLKVGDFEFHNYRRKGSDRIDFDKFIETEFKRAPDFIKKLANSINDRYGGDIDDSVLSTIDDLIDNVLEMGKRFLTTFGRPKWYVIHTEDLYTYSTPDFTENDLEPFDVFTFKLVLDEDYEIIETESEEDEDEDEEEDEEEEDEDREQTFTLSGKFVLPEKE